MIPKLKSLQKNFRYFEWLALMRLLKKLKLTDVRYFFKSRPSMGFQTREVADFLIQDSNLEITANFMGLQGASTPMPLHFTELIVQDDPDDSTLNELLNFFNHRFYEALFAIDTKYHYVAQALPEYNDPLSQNLQALAGLPMIPSPSKKALQYQLLPALQYMMGGRVSRQGLCLFLQRTFPIQKAALKERVKKALAIPVQEQGVLGVQGVLGESLMLGAYAYQSSLHFELHLYVEQVASFLPGSAYFLQLKDIVNYMLKAPLFVTLVLHATRVNLPVLGFGSGFQLGYTSVLVRDGQHAYCVHMDLL